MKPEKQTDELPRWLASLATKKAIAGLRPDLVPEIRRRMDRKGSLSEKEAQEWLAQLREEARRPKLPTVSVEQAQALHRQSGEALVEKQKAKVREAVEEPRQRDDVVTINLGLAQFWWEEQQFAAAQRRQFLEWDELGLYGGSPSMADVVARQDRRWQK